MFSPLTSNKECLINKLGGWGAKADSQWWLNIKKEEGKTFPEQTSKARVWLREQEAECTRERAKETQQRNRADQKFQHGDRSHMSAHKGSVRKSLQRQSLSLLCAAWFLSLFLLSLLGTSSITYTAHPPKTNSPSLLLLFTLQRDVQVGRGGPVGWSGVGRVKSKQIHLLPRLSCWLAAGSGPASTQPAAWRKAYTQTERHTSKNTTLTGWSIFTFFLLYK